MANLNKVMFIGRLTRDPEVRSFSNGGKVAKFGFAVSNRKKNPSTGAWEDEPMFIDVDVFNRGEKWKLADRVEQFLRKGQQVFLEGSLWLDQWTSQDGQKRSKHKVVLDNFEFFEPRRDSGSTGSDGGMSRPRSNRPENNYEEPVHHDEPMEVPHRGGGDEEIPF